MPVEGRPLTIQILGFWISQYGSAPLHVSPAWCWALSTFCCWLKTSGRLMYILGQDVMTYAGVYLLWQKILPLQKTNRPQDAGSTMDAFIYEHVYLYGKSMMSLWTPSLSQQVIADPFSISCCMMLATWTPPLFAWGCHLKEKQRLLCLVSRKSPIIAAGGVVKVEKII